MLGIKYMHTHLCIAIFATPSYIVKNILGLAPYLHVCMHKDFDHD